MRGSLRCFIQNGQMQNGNFPNSVQWRKESREIIAKNAIWQAGKTRNEWKRGLTFDKIDSSQHDGGRKDYG